MKKRFISLFIFTLFFIAVPLPVSAAPTPTKPPNCTVDNVNPTTVGPDIAGYVKTKGTNAPVVGVWVKWTDTKGHIRYAKTDGDGRYFFKGWQKNCNNSQGMDQQERDEAYNTQIDTDLDGTNDARLASLSDVKAFRCAENPHTFSVVQPKPKSGSFSAGGTFSLASGEKMNNTAANHKNPDMTYTPPPSTPTPKPPACNEACDPANNKCTIGCPVCAPQNGTGPNVCQKAPACGAQCSPDAPPELDCPQNCPVCAKDGSGKNICQKPPACGASCVTGTEGLECPQECPVCAAGSGGGGKVCQQPAPTATPIPTATPLPTATPKPVCGAECVPSDNQCPQECPVCHTSQDSNGATICRNQPFCDCDGMDVTGEFAPGGTVEFKAYAKVANPETNDAETQTMVFHVFKNDVEVANSGEIAVGTPERTTDKDGSTPIDRYTGTWSYTVPAAGSGEVKYSANVKINCGYKSGNGGSARGPQSVRVLAANTKNTGGFWENIFAFFANVFQLEGAQPTPTPPFPETGPDENTEVSQSQDTKSLKLGTFAGDEPTPTPRVEKACKEVRFWINYPQS